MRVFLPWTSHLLPEAAAHLVGSCVVGAANFSEVDLGDWLVVVRGRNAGRRLLVLLAAEAQAAGRALIPPRIVTPGVMEQAMFECDSPVAGNVMQRLAWTMVVQRASPRLLGKIWKSPEWQNPRRRAFSLGGLLDRTWRQLGTSGADFSDAIAVLERVAPDVVELERERWEAMGKLLEDYRKTLQDWGLADPSDARARLAKSGKAKPGLRVAVVGVVELAPLLVGLLRRLPEEPTVFIHAPESEAAGFDEWGRLNFSHWAKRPCAFASGEIHVVRGVKEQADRCAGLIALWQRGGIPASAVTIAVPEPEALPALLHGLRDAQIEARAAEGNPTSRTAVFQFLSHLADFLDRPEGGPPLYASVAALVRHPDLTGVARCSAERLDTYFERHLPMRMEPNRSDSGTNTARVAAMLERFEKLGAIRSTHFAEDLTQVLLRIYERRRLDRHSSEGRAVMRSLEAVRDVLDEIKTLPRAATVEMPVADILRLVIETAGDVEIPAPEQPGAVELAGWLEAAADDAPALIVTSVFEGSLPEGAASEPLLVDRLRQELGLPCRASRHARDQYTLHAVWMSRRQSGRIALLAPRRSAAGVPTRPSRLLLAAHEGAALAGRLLSVTSDPRSITTLPKGGAGHSPPEPDAEKMRRFRVFPVTSFSTYIRSPLLFYFQHVLGLGAQDDSADELDAAKFGTAIHSVLQTFGDRCLTRKDSPIAKEIARDVKEILGEYMASRFGRYALPLVRAQFRSLEARLEIFAERQAAAFSEGWEIAYVEKRSVLEVDFPVGEALSDVKLRGKIDRIDRHRDGRWRVIDYKTSANAKEPDQAHFGSHSGVWKDLQLPLYVKLLPGVTIPDGQSVSPEGIELVYFNLPPNPDQAGITSPFDASKIGEAWSKAEEIVAKVCGGEGCREIGKTHADEDPTFLALCGLNGLPIIDSED